MMHPRNSLYVGALMHRRYRPVRHELRFNVADVFLDVDQLGGLSRQSLLFGYNQRKLFSIHDRNHGADDGKPIAQHVRGVMAGLELQKPVSRIFMLCYPAVFGRVFNPLTVYFGFGAEDEWLAVVYEVNNTFGQRHSYAMAIDGGKPHAAEKKFYVSPFNPAEGEYHFSVERERGHMRLNIALFEQGQMKLAARFEGNEQAFSTAALLRSLPRLVVQPLKVILGIHWHALLLWMKGLRLTPRPAHGRFEFSMPTRKVKP